MRPGASCAPMETGMAEDLRGVIGEMKLLRISIGGMNPDPQETIQACRDRLAAQQRAADHLVTATEALVRTTSWISKTFVGCPCFVRVRHRIGPWKVDIEAAK